MGQTAKDSCPGCGVKFRTGGLLPAEELRRLSKVGVIDLGEPPNQLACPQCQVLLKVVSVQMGTFFIRA